MQRKISRYFVICFSLSALIGCVSRAPSDCELDKRSGLYPSSFCENTSNSDDKVEKNKSVSNIRPSSIPVRSEPLIKRVWVNDQILEGGHWMQGTWIYIEVEPSKWVGSELRQPASNLSQGANQGKVQPEKSVAGRKK